MDGNFTNGGNGGGSNVDRGGSIDRVKGQEDCLTAYPNSGTGAYVAISFRLEGRAFTQTDAAGNFGVL